MDPGQPQLSDPSQMDKVNIPEDNVNIIKGTDSEDNNTTGSEEDLIYLLPTPPKTSPSSLMRLYNRQLATTGSNPG